MEQEKKDIQNDIVFKNREGLNVFQRLAEVRKLVYYIQKTGSVSFGNTKYTSTTSRDVLKAFNQAINDNGLFLKVEIVNQQMTEFKDNKGNLQFKTTLDMKYTWINIDNPSDISECLWAGQGIDSLEKGIGKALTYAERYFLLKFFNVATDDLDPESYKLTIQSLNIPSKLLECTTIESLNVLYNEYKNLVDDIVKFNKIVSDRKKQIEKEMLENAENNKK